MAPYGFQIPSTGKNCAIVGCIYFAVLQQHLDRSSSGRRDTLADGFRSFGIGVVVMDRSRLQVPSQMAPSGFQIPSTGKNCAIVGCINFAVLQQRLYRSSSGRRDRLAEGLRSFGIGVVVMDRHGTPVPHGYFHATAMLQHADEIPGDHPCLFRVI